MAVVQMSYSHELTLISTTITYDDLFQEIITEVKDTVLCRLLSVGGTEFYNAQVRGLKPEIKFIIHAFEYAGQKMVEFQGQKYRVIRTYEEDSMLSNTKYKNILKHEELELTCERVGADG